LIAIVDAGPLYESIVSGDINHIASAATLQRPDLELVVPTLVVAEVSYFLHTRHGGIAEAGFVRRLATEIEVEAPLPAEWSIIADLVERYADFPLGATDASVAVLAERLDTDIIITLDHRHFRALRMSNGRPFRLLPD
jgi:uncharacterized protein